MREKPKPNQISVKIDRDQYERVVELAFRRGRPVTWQFRRLIQSALENDREELKA